MKLANKTLLSLALLIPVVGVATTTIYSEGQPTGIQPVELVNNFIGTDGTGHTFPGPSRPFGMVQPGPDNADNGWEYTSGYQYKYPKIMGFSQNRASGTGIPELGDVLLQPTDNVRQDLSSNYDKSSEVASPGYYAVQLTDNHVHVEVSSTLRSAIYRYRFDRPGRVWVFVDLQHGLTFNPSTQPVVSVENQFSKDGFSGHAVRTNWTTRHIAWSAQFSKPILEVIKIGPRPQNNDRPADVAPRVMLGFDIANNEPLLVKIGLSNTDEAGALLNRDEIPNWDFDQVVRDSKLEWNELLSRIKINGSLNQKKIFTTALYHALLHPSVISDRDGRWRGVDEKIHQTHSGIRYSTFSLWDTMRAAWQLDTLIVPERIDDFVKSLLDNYDQSGRLPVWPIWGSDTGTMIGEPALSVIADATSKGFQGFDYQKAKSALVKTATEDHALSEWSVLDRYGYLPFDMVNGESVSRTLELGLASNAVSKFAAATQDFQLQKTFLIRSQYWMTLLDPKTHLARGKDSHGNWRSPFDPITPTSPLNNPGDYTEANAWQYTWAPALQDPAKFAAVMGGKRQLGDMLDTFFFKLPSTTGAAYLGQEAMIGQDAHGNEPSHHIPWLYAFTDRPDTGHCLIKKIAESFYLDAPNGIIGNDDAGQMSAWYVFATLGFYPVAIANGTYVAGIPLVKSAILSVPGHKQLTIHVNGEGDHLSNVLVNSIKANKTDISHRQLSSGGDLEFLTTLNNVKFKTSQIGVNHTPQVTCF